MEKGNVSETRAFLKRAAELEGMLFSCRQARMTLELRQREDVSDVAREKGQYKIGDNVPKEHKTPGDIRREREAREAFFRSGGIARSVEYVGPIERYPGTMPSNYMYTRGLKEHSDRSLVSCVFNSLLLGFPLGIIAAVLFWILSGADIGFKMACLGTVSGFCVLSFFLFWSNRKWKPSEEDKKQADEYDEVLSRRNAVLSKELAIDSYAKNYLPDLILNENKLREALRQHYSAGIVHEKYQEFTAVTQIYEYFETGRCDELTGANGAYNLYEAELRSNIIISQLAQIVSQLENIKQNQYLIYRAIQETNDLLGGIYQELNSLEGAINANTAVIANFNASVTARL